MSTEIILNRLGLLAELVRKAPLSSHSIMNMLLFLQESRGVPLGYDFSLYSYGPCDFDVSAEISLAKRLRVLQSTKPATEYQYSRGADADNLESSAKSFVQAHKTDINWAVESFSRKTGSEMELLGTIFYIAKYQNPESADRLIAQVAWAKPCCSEGQIRRGFGDLVNMGVLVQPK